MSDVPLVDQITDPAFRAAVLCIDAGSVAELQGLLAANPGLSTRQFNFGDGGYFTNPCLLEFVAQNPIRQRTMPNVIEVVEAIVAAGGGTKETLSATLGLVATGCVPRENGVQLKLIEVLCGHGAVVGPSLTGVLVHGEFAAAEALLQRGAPMTLSVAAALDRAAEFDALLPSASAEERHTALAFAAQHGRSSMLKKLLDMGEDPNRLNPPLCHSHSTPLHQAVYYQHADAVKLLLAARARTDIPDTMHSGTAVGWAEYGNLPAMVSILKGEE